MIDARAPGNPWSVLLSPCEASSGAEVAVLLAPRSTPLPFKSEGSTFSGVASFAKLLAPLLPLLLPRRGNDKLNVLPLAEPGPLP